MLGKSRVLRGRVIISTSDGIGPIGNWTGKLKFGCESTRDEAIPMRDGRNGFCMFMTCFEIGFWTASTNARIFSD